MRPTLVFPPELEIPPTTAVRSILLIGRHPHCDVVLKVSSVSRRHCVLVESGDELIIRDLGSRHGVWVNGKRVEERSLFVGDEIAIGPVFVRVVDPDRLNPDSVSDDSTDAADLSTEEQGVAARRSNPGFDSDSGFLATEPMRPTSSEPDSSGTPSDDDWFQDSTTEPASDSGDDDIPSDSNLEIVL